MSRFSISIPELAGQEQAQATLGIDPDTVARIGLQYVDNPPPGARLKKWTINSDEGYIPCGYIAPLRQAGYPQLYLRMLLPVVDRKKYIPTTPNELTARLQWHQNELNYMAEAGATIPVHYPIIVNDQERWGNQCALFTAVQAIKGRETSRHKDSQFAWRQGGLRKVGGILLRFFTEPQRPTNEVIFDGTSPRQFTGITYHDIDPFKTSDLPHQLRLLEWINWLKPCAEARQLQKDFAEAKAVIL